MQRNATKCNRNKSFPLLATPDKANQGHNEATPARGHECKQAERGHTGPIASLATGSESGQIGPRWYRGPPLLATPEQPRAPEVR